MQPITIPPSNSEVTGTSAFDTFPTRPRGSDIAVPVEGWLAVQVIMLYHVDVMSCHVMWRRVM